MGIRGDISNIGTVLPETTLGLAQFAPGGAVTALQAIEAALGQSGGVEYENAYSFVTVGGVAMPRDGRHYWAFYVNDRAASAGISDLEIHAGDRIVLYLTSFDEFYNESPLYSYFKVTDVRFDNSGYPFASVRLGFYTTDWMGAVVPITNAAVKYDSIYGALSEITDSVNGHASFDIYPYETNGDSVFDFYSDETRFSRPFCRVTVATDSTGQITSVRSSQPASSDTGLRAFTLAFPNLPAQSMLSSIGDTPITVGDVAGVTLSAVVNDSAAVAALRYRTAGGSFTAVGNPAPSFSDIWLPLGDGENTIELTVTNGNDSEINMLTLIKGANSGDAAQTVHEVINGIFALPSNVTASSHLPDWSLGFSVSGTPLPKEAVEGLLAGVLNSIPASQGSAAKTAIALSALGIDARLIPDRSNPGNIINLVALACAKPDFSPIGDAQYILSLFDLDIYEMSAAFDRSDLINAILDAQNPNGSFGSNIDDTAMMLPALSTYYGASDAVNGVPAALCERVTAAVDKALAWISSNQLADGGFDGTYGRNSNTTSIVIIGLSSLNIDAHTDPRFIKAGRSLVDHLLTFRTSDGRLGYTNGAAYNDYATVQGFQALALWENVISNKPGNLYGFAEHIAPYYDWPDTDLLTSIILTPPAKLNYQIGEALDTAGMRVIAEYNGDPSNHAEIPEAEYSVAAPSIFERAGAASILVSYKSQTASFIVTVSGSGGGGTGNIKTVRISVTDHEGTQLASDARMIIEPGVTSVLDALKRLLNNAGKSFTADGANYVSSIDGLAEMGKGPNSGWIFLVNGVDPVISAESYKLSGGENIQWKYTLDYTKEPGSANFPGGGGGGGAAASATKAALSSETVAAAVISLSAKPAADGKATVALTAADADKAVAALKQAQKALGGKANADSVVFIRVAAENAAALDLSIPKESLAVLSANADRLSIESAPGDALIGSAALKSLASRAADTLVISFSTGGSTSGAGGGNETTADSVSASTAQPTLSFSMRFGDKEISSFGGAVIAGLHYKPAPGEKPARLFARVSNADAADQESSRILYSLFDSSSDLMRVICSAPLSFSIECAEESFADVSGHWAETYIEFLAARGGVHGVSPDEFKPGGDISRAQLIQMIYNLSDPKASGESVAVESGFEDVSSASWYAGALAWAKNHGVITGEKTASGYAFRPNDTISRQEIAVIFERYTKIAEWPPTGGANGGSAINTAGDTTTTGALSSSTGGAVGVASAFSDSDSISSYAAYAVEHMRELGILNGIANSDGSLSFQPGKNAGRAEAAKMISMLVISAFF
jgi:hypothetical protein